MKLHENFIGGEWAKAAERAPNINPSNLADVVGEFARADAAQTRAAIAAARAAAHSPLMKFCLMPTKVQ